MDGAIVDELAVIFRSNSYDLRLVVETLLKSAHFFDTVNIGAMIKSPAVFMAGLSRQFAAHPGGGRLADDMRAIEQNLLDPPNVAGWEGYRTWISTTTYPLRKLN